jgi:hypothetical protein
MGVVEQWEGGGLTVRCFYEGVPGARGIEDELGGEVSLRGKEL